jgi:wyosine [tRNA(Phe)-imidazoG37] synthetase (radical SAM superfamily)
VLNSDKIIEASPIMGRLSFWLFTTFAGIIIQAMDTFLFDSTIFGPVNSRRLGVSLGINLLPNTYKICNFDCIYCECGWSGLKTEKGKDLPSRQKVSTQLEAKLKEMRREGEKPDTLTFAGNGEPTLHPEFASIIDNTIHLRDMYYPEANIAVLSNATRIDKPNVFAALKKVRHNILKLDSAFEETIRLINRPPQNYSLERTIRSLAAFKGDFILQTMFVKGRYEGKDFDNTTKTETEAWLKVVKRLSPRQVMIYTIARATPCKAVERVDGKTLEKIAQKVKNLGIDTHISA